MADRSRFPRSLPALAAAAALTALSACEPVISTHGYAPPEERLAEIQPGVDGMETVQRKVGRPSTSGVIRQDTWYYVGATFETMGWSAPEEVERRVVAISFGADGLVRSVDQYGLEEGRIINLVTRTTPTYGREMTVLQQIFGNIGNLSADSAPSGLLNQ